MFSDHVVLGSSLVKLLPSTWLTTTTVRPCGCFIGMAAKSHGRDHFHANAGSMAKIYPWLMDSFLVPSPIKNSRHWMSAAWGLSINGHAKAWAIISVFAYEVHEGKVSFEDAISWIRSVEGEERVAEQCAEPVREESCNSVPSAEAVAK